MTKRVLFFNVLITFALIGAFIISPPVIHYIITAISDSKSDPIEVTSPSYEGYKWPSVYYSDINKLTTNYHDYIVWRRNDLSSQTINITDGLRHTKGQVHGLNGIDKSSVWFFGGSTTWGQGVPDALTYPSLFAEKTGLKSINFGEGGYISRQSLALLTNQLASGSVTDLEHARTVVFYDGVNDVVYRCQSGTTSLGSGRERQIRNLIDRASEQNKYSFSRTFWQFEDLVDAFIRRGSTFDWAAYYYCDDDETRATEVAKSLVNSWAVAHALSEGLGWRFVAVLQPVAHYNYSHSTQSYLNLSSDQEKEIKKQFASIYPKIIELAKTQEFEFVDMTRIFEGCKYCYIDFCHTGPEGNDLIAAEISKILAR